MFKKRRLCRFAFVLIGVLPLLATVAYAGWRNTRFDAAHFADLLGRSFGCHATIGNADFVRPGMLRLTEVAFSNPETGQSLLRCDAVDVNRIEGALRLSISKVAVADMATDQVLYAIHERILRQPTLLREEVILSIEELSFNRVPDCRFSKNTIELRQTSNGTELRSAFYPESSLLRNDPTAPIDPMAPIDLTMQRNFISPARTRVKLETGPHALPMSLIVGQRNWLPQLTSSATFQGNIWWVSTPQGWTGDVVGGYLRDVELANFLGDRFGGWMDGLADITIYMATFANSRLQELVVDIDSVAGKVRTQQLAAAADVWQLNWTEQPLMDTDFVDYQRLECRVKLANGRIELRGGKRPMGTILTLETAQQLTTFPAELAYGPVNSIMAVLLPDQPSQGLVSKDAERLMRVLPLSVTP